MPVFDYRCKNEDCPRQGKTETILCKVAERDDQRCGACGITMDRRPSAPATSFFFADRSPVKRSRS